MKIIAFILSFYILFSAVIPCSVFDNCQGEEHTAGSSGSEQRKDCNGCSPFSICSAAQGFTVTNNTPSIEPAEFYFPPSYGNFHFSFTSEYFSNLFQPPRNT
jgi:hypothetical protein